MVRAFLTTIAVLIFLAVGARIAWEVWDEDIIRWYAVPERPFEAQAATAPRGYANPGMWFARAGKTRGNPARWTPEGYAPADSGPVATFYIHPTSYLEPRSWNAPLADEESQERARIFLRSQASVFNGIGPVWAPRYRQATFGAFLTSQPEAQMALDAAYRDIEAAFDRFLEELPADMPVILAGHSQGALHLTTLLRTRIAGTPLADRVVAAYVVGWPVSVANDLPALGLPACEQPDDSGCILSWLSYAEPAEPGMVIEAYDATTGFDGQTRREQPMLCTNPVTGTLGGSADAEDNLGTLIPNAELTDAVLEPGTVPARCGERGLLFIGAAPDLGPYVLPGNNYHVYDYPLFWVNVRQDAERRVAAFLAR